MLAVTFDHIQLRSPEPEATALWLRDMLGGTISTKPGRVDVRLGGVNIFIAMVEPGDGVGPPPVSPYQGLDHFGLTVPDLDDAVAELKKRALWSLRSLSSSGAVFAPASFADPREFRSNFSNDGLRNS